MIYLKFIYFCLSYSQQTVIQIKLVVQAVVVAFVARYSEDQCSRLVPQMNQIGKTTIRSSLGGSRVHSNLEQCPKFFFPFYVQKRYKTVFN